jgi:hypothetical protein
VRIGDELRNLRPRFGGFREERGREGERRSDCWPCSNGPVDGGDGDPVLRRVTRGRLSGEETG